MGKRVDLRRKGFWTWHATTSFSGKAATEEHSGVDHNDVMDMTAARIADWYGCICARVVHGSSLHLQPERRR
jgi:hypothetical protein